MLSTPAETLGRVLRRAREGLNRSPEQVGALVSISGRTVRRLEEGEAGRPRRMTLEALGGFYGLNPDVMVELAELSGPPEQMLEWLRDRATVALGPGVTEALYGVDDEPVELAMRLARSATSAGDASPQRGKTQSVISFLRDPRTPSPREHTEAVDAFANFLALDRSRRALVRQLVEDLRRAQEAEHGQEPPP